MGDALLQPGNNIKPILSIEDAKDILKDTYGLTCSSVTQLNGYDDVNYKVIAEDETNNENISIVCKNGYVLKVMNSLDSKNVAVVEAQNALMLYLDKNNVRCPKLVKTKHDRYYIRKNLKSGSHVIRLLEFIPGTILHQIPCSNIVFYQAGQYVAKLNLILEKFHHPAYNTHRTIWMLDSVPQLKQFLSAISDEKKVDTVKRIIQDFEDRVLAVRNDLEAGMIHGDFNEQNIIVNRENGTSEWKIAAVLDFGDSQFSCYLYELAIAMTYMMILGKDLNAGGHVIAGYTSVKQLKVWEINLLKICICARLCQSLVMGAYTSLQHPENEYLLTTAASGWELLLTLWNKPEETVLQNWKNIVLEYNIEHNSDS